MWASTGVLRGSNSKCGGKKRCRLWCCNSAVMIKADRTSGMECAASTRCACNDVIAAPLLLSSKHSRYPCSPTSKTPTAFSPNHSWFKKKALPILTSLPVFRYACSNEAGFAILCFSINAGVCMRHSIFNFPPKFTFFGCNGDFNLWLRVPDSGWKRRNQSSCRASHIPRDPSNSM